MVNSDYLSENGPTTDPPSFADPPIESCTLSFSRIFDPDTNDFVRDEDGEERIHSGVMIKNGLSSTFDNAYPLFSADDDDDDDCDDSDSSIIINTNDYDNINDNDNDDRIEQPPLQPERAYLYVRNDDTNISHAIYGDVHCGKVLQSRSNNTGWQLTSEKCAIKTMPWKKIKKGRIRGQIEDPRTEIAAMILLKTFYLQDRAQAANGGNGIEPTAREAMRKTNLVMPLDFLFDRDNLYIVMPYCDGGELLNSLTFTEEMCRTKVVPQILNGLKFLQMAKICHRDISLENFVLDGNGENMKLIIIDLGMARRIPYSEDNTRQLISPQYRCGKVPYISPEIYQQEPFDGHAVDLWAVGVILFILLNGFHPWKDEVPHSLSPKYTIMTGGNLVRMFRNTPGLNASESSIYLLDRMLRSNPQDRFSLQQILVHRWINEMT